MKYEFQCPKCRQVIQQDWISCPYCGSILPARGEFISVHEESHTRLNGLQEYSKRRKNALVWGLIGGLVVGIFLVIILVIIGVRRSNYLETQSEEQGTTSNLANERSIQSTATSQTGVVFGPADGTLAHNPSNYVTAHCADVSLKNFRTTVIFYAPYSVGLNSWDYGIFFRDTGSAREYRLEMFSDGGWHLVFVGPTMWSTIRAGHLTGFVNEEGTAYHLELAVQDNEAVFSVNGKIVETLDVSLKQEPGDICVTTGNYVGNAIEGEVTRYEDFTVYDRP